MIEALIFDMDGLLFDSERVVQRSWNIAGDELGFGRVGENIYNTLGMNLKSRTAYFKSVYGSDFPMDRFADRTREIYYNIAREEGVPLKPGVKAILEYGRQHGYKMGVATSSRRAHAAKTLKESGIYDYFETCVSGDMVEHAKPDPEIYETACRQLGVQPRNAMALEDAPNGIYSAARAGMYAVMIPDLVEPDDSMRKITYRICRDLYGVIDLLEHMD